MEMKDKLFVDRTSIWMEIHGYTKLFELGSKVFSLYSQAPKVEMTWNLPQKLFFETLLWNLMVQSMPMYECRYQRRM